MTSPSKRLGPYELVRRLGAGGMAETFLAVRSGPAGFRQQVCLKRVLPALVQDQGFVQLFLDEARIQSQLRHGNIVQVYDFGEADGAYYLALELVDGVDLNALLRYLGQRGQALPPSVVLHVLRELCRALEVTHALAIDGVAQNLVHRDISPSNILVSVAGEVKLTDFGIALAQSRESKTETGKMRGKLGYMPPEQIHGEVLDARSDLFSVGVVLYQMLTGEHPFRKAGMSDYDVLTRVVRGEHAPVRELAPSVSADLAALCEAMIASDRELRPRNAREILEHTVSLVPPAHADRELAERVAAVQAAQHIAQPGADAQRESQRLTVPGPGPNDPTRAHGERVKTERVHTERSRLESPSWVHDPTRAVDTPLSVPLTAAVSVGPSRRALGVLVASLLLAAGVSGLWVRAELARSQRLGSGQRPSLHLPVASAARASEVAVLTASPAATSPLADSDASVAADARPSAVVAVEPPPSAAQPSEGAVTSTAIARADASGYATLRVMVSPFGTVSLDGERLGDAPARKQVRAGSHVVSATNASGAHSQSRITLARGESRTIRLRLSAPP